MQAVPFKNWTKKAFSWKWDGVDYNFAPGETQYMPSDLANHFAKHLASREMNEEADEKEKKEKGSGVTFIEKDPRFVELVNKALPGGEEDVIEAEDDTSLSVKIMTKNAESKKKRAKKDEDINPEFE